MPHDKPLTGPLSGLKIVDLTAVLMGPSATQMLADLGADVIKVETSVGDATRKIGPQGDAGMGPVYLAANRNKRSIVLDLAKPPGREAFLRLVKDADVLTTNVRPDGMKRLRLTYQDVAEVNERIIYVSMVGFSQRGRYARSPAFDDLIQAATAVPWAVAANTDDEPHYVPVNIADRSVGLYAFGIVLAAVYSRNQTGKGQQVDVPMFETMVPYVLGDHLYGHKFLPPQGDFGYPRLLAKARQPYRTKDAWVCCAIYHDHHWKAFLEVVGMGHLWGTDPRLTTMTTRTAHSEELNAFVRDQLVLRTTAQWQEALATADIPVFPMNTFESLLDDPHLRDIGFFSEVDHPHVGKIREMAVPSEWHGTPPANYRPPPLQGEQSADILREVGYSESQIEQMLQDGITHQPPASPGGTGDRG
ncbi:Formyl-coenzyme A transferase [Variovorax sp. PBL-H6]|uniref:CaiB/BaiF CoA transferase family protein n=1 Tax=Variovorax sp. PBL-H6 TaxID=434009 RepID=UPI001318A513|nr:CoA transferase [Variovorax sp. PBL-H6]VTU27186.1 Formyl-coenzyme A transferase [Variovorax sp. PBL-H6]